MGRVIQQSVVLPAAAGQLFDMYLDPAVHGAITGHQVVISAEPRAMFRAFNDQLSGQILTAIRPRLIVQSWRSTKFHADDPDSLLILAFSQETTHPISSRIDLVHIDVPDHDFQDVTEGWTKYYWIPWHKYLER